MATAKVQPGREVYQLMIRLKYEPTIWRRVVLEGDTSLYILHHIIQIVMGWGNYHMHQFTANRRCYGDPEGDLDFEDEGKATLAGLLPRVRQKMDYEYDFGDSWLHDIRVEKLLPREEGTRYPVCVAGARHCPPVDCGGIGGYEMFLKAISQRKHPDHEQMTEWIGGKFDPEAFNIEHVNLRLEHLRPRVLQVKTRAAKKGTTKRARKK